MSNNCVFYLEDTLDPKKRRVLINRIVRHLKPIASTFDAIAVRGLSGMLVGPEVAGRLSKQIVVVRKNDDLTTHSGHRVEGSPGSSYIILDDLVDTGKTVDLIRARIADKSAAKCVGIYTYFHPQKNPHLTYSGIPYIVNATDDKNANAKCGGYMAKWL